MEPLTAMFPVCTLIKSDGIRCGSPALKGCNFCFQHIGGNIRALTKANSETRYANAKLKFAYPGDRQAIQHNLFLVAEALSDGMIDDATASTYNRLFRSCDLNLRRWAAEQQSGVTERMFRLSDEELEQTGQQSDSDPYADLRHLPSPEYAYRVSERIAQRHEAERAAKTATADQSGAPSLPPAPEGACTDFAEDVPGAASFPHAPATESACPEPVEGVGEESWDRPPVPGDQEKNSPHHKVVIPTEVRKADAVEGPAVLPDRISS